MKNNKPIRKFFKSSKSKLSPSIKNKSNKYNNFNLTSFKNNEFTNLLSSPKKTKEDSILPKKKIFTFSAYHPKKKSSSQNYEQFQNLINEENYHSNFLKTGNYKANTNSRNKYDFFKKKFNENKKSSNLLSFSFSLKEFRNNIINSFINSNYNELQKSNKSNLKYNKSLYIFDNLNNIEETRNTTSITGFNNSNLFYKNQIMNKEDKKIKSSKIIKINRKPEKQLFSPNSNSTKIIKYSNNTKNIKEKENEKNKLSHYIYNYNNININPKNDFKNIKNKSSNPNKNLSLSSKTYKNSLSKLNKSRKISFVNAISENLNMHYKNKVNNYKIKNNFNYNIKSLKNNSKKNIHKSFSKRKNRSQENKAKMQIEYINEIGQFQSVEEIHFIFVQMNQKKKAFFENKCK